MAVRIVHPDEGGIDIDKRMVAVHHIMAKIQADEAKATQARVRPKLVEILEAIEPDADGHRTWVLDEPVMDYGAIVYQRRVSHVPDYDRIMEILEQIDLVDQCTELKRVPDEDAIMNAVFDGKIPEALLKEMYPMKETFAVVVKRA
jgi:hypothetical protein